MRYDQGSVRKQVHRHESSDASAIMVVSVFLKFMPACKFVLSDKSSRHTLFSLVPAAQTPHPTDLSPHPTPHTPLPYYPNGQSRLDLSR